MARKKESGYFIIACFLCVPKLEGFISLPKFFPFETSIRFEPIHISDHMCIIRTSGEAVRGIFMRSGMIYIEASRAKRDIGLRPRAPRTEDFSWERR